MHAENGTFARCFCDDVRENEPFTINKLRDGGWSKTRPFTDVNRFLDRMNRIARIDRMAPVI